MAFQLGLRPPLGKHFKNFNSSFFSSKPIGIRKLLAVRLCALAPKDAQKLVVEVKEKLEKECSSLPAGKNGKDDEELILWFLKDRRFSVEEAVPKLTKAIRWYHEFGVSELSEESVRSAAESGKAYVHDYLDVNSRPVQIVEASKHFPGKHDFREDEKLCVFLVEKALSKLPAGKEQILVIIDLRGFGTENADLRFLTFLFDVFYYYYPRRLSEVLFIDAPFIFQPIWQLAKPMLKSYASLVRFCSAEVARDEYFTDETVPANLRKR
ncbi:phosphatidylinositol transfer protein CSR1 isoform X1 [Coffea eugenioides]|uniref:phosphatidylinositol transfer protein CSR1 isoform X1 n=1 Tax=Coffea eugenioides TaxID=49369 RepID=UPI000F60DB49|nr:phosphatidylinositol transfer protein CSR1 isoform X1 [Coffea eugenioides]